MGYRRELMFLNRRVSSANSYGVVLPGSNEQMYSDTPASKVVDTQHTADDISTKIIKYKDFPDRITILV